MVAKRFFYVSAGLLSLALAYHVGARSATAQLGLVEAGKIDVSISGTGIYTCAVGRTFYTDYAGTAISVPVPGSARIVATGLGSRGYTAMLENGDLYWFNQEPSVVAWQYLGNMLGSATPVTRETWGGVKARYRPEGTAKQADK